MNINDTPEFERFYNRLLIETPGAFICVVTNPPTLQREVTDELIKHLPHGEARVINFADVRQVGFNYRFSSFSLNELGGDARVLLLMNFHLAGGDLSDDDFIQVINLSRDNLAEMPYIFVFMMPMYFRVKLAQKAPDFNSFIRFRADFINNTEREKPGYIRENKYSPANIKLLEYYKEQYDSQQDPDSEQAFEYLVYMLKLNADLRVLQSVEFKPYYEAFEKLLHVYNPETEEMVWRIANIYTHQGNYEEALKWREKERLITEETYGLEHPKTAITYNNLAVVYSDQGKYNEALNWYQKSLSIKKKIYGAEHRDIAGTYDNIARVYDNQGKYDEALEWYEKALAMRKSVLGEEHTDTAITYHNMAFVYDSLGEYEKALELYKSSLEIKYKILPLEHPRIAASYHCIAWVYYNQGNYIKALGWFGKSIYILYKVLGVNHTDTIKLISNARTVFTALHNTEDGFYDWCAAQISSQPDLTPVYPD